MQNIRCLIAGIPQIILADIIQQISENSSGIEVVNRIDDTKNLSQVVKHQDIDVLMLGMNEMKSPELLSEVLNMSPQLTGVGIFNDGRRICICIDDVGPDEFMALINIAVKKRKSS